MNNELMSVLEGMAHDRGIDKESLLSLVEESVATAISRDNNVEVEVSFNRKTGEMSAYTSHVVVQSVQNPSAEISLYEAQMTQPNIKIGETFRQKIPTARLSRIAAQVTGQIIRQKLRTAEKINVCKDFENQKGQLIIGVVRGIERNGDIRIDFGRAEGVLPKKERIPGDDYTVGEHVTALLLEINAVGSGPSLIVSKTHPNFIKCLFERDIAEIRDGTLEVKSIAREAGKRSKIAVHTTSPKLDPVGACIGVRGSRIKMILKEIGEEKIDIIQWNEDPRIFVQNAIQPAKLISSEIDEENHQVLITVHPNQLSLAIGRAGQNARLAVQLTGWKIKILKTDDADFSDNVASTSNLFEEKKAEAIQTLAQIDGILPEEAQVLVENGFMSAEGIVATDSDYLASLQGINTIERAEKIIEAARASMV